MGMLRDEVQALMGKMCAGYGMLKLCAVGVVVAGPGVVEKQHFCWLLGVLCDEVQAFVGKLGAWPGVKKTFPSGLGGAGPGKN